MASYYDAYDDGFADGVKKGSENGTGGYDSGYAAGYAEGETCGYASGHAEGAASGYAAGVASGQRLPVTGRPTIHLDTHTFGIPATFVLWDMSDDATMICGTTSSGPVEAMLANVDTVEMPNLTTVGDHMFSHIGGNIASDSITFNLPKVTDVLSSGFYDVGGENTSSIDVSLPACTAIASAAFENSLGGSISLPGMETTIGENDKIMLPIDDKAFGSASGEISYFTRWDLTIPGVPLAAVENSAQRSGAIEGHVFGLADNSTITCSDGVYTVG